jgi:hypothetical protein
MRSAIASRDALERFFLRAGALNRSRTTSDFDSLRLRDSPSISATNASGSLTVSAFMAQVYYEPGMVAIRALARSLSLRSVRPSAWTMTAA